MLVLVLCSESFRNNLYYKSFFWKISPKALEMSFVVEHIFLFDFIWTYLLFLFWPLIFRIMSHIFFAGVLELRLETYCCQDVLLADVYCFASFYSHLFGME